MAKKVIQKISLYYTAGTSDKEYCLTLDQDTSGLFNVIANYGRRGHATTHAGVLKGASEATALKAFNNKLNEKIKKGYTSDISGTPGLGLTTSVTKPAKMPFFFTCDTVDTAPEPHEVEYYLACENWTNSIILNISIASALDRNPTWFKVLPVHKDYPFTPSLEVGVIATNLANNLKAKLVSNTRKWPSVTEIVLLLSNKGQTVQYLGADGTIEDDRDLANFLMPEIKAVLPSDKEVHTSIGCKVFSDDFDELFATGLHGFFKKKGTFSFISIEDLE